jgi:hypothetical protein
MGVKIGRFLDNIFQNFLTDFAIHIYDRKPIKKAQYHLQGRIMEGEVHTFFRSIQNGIVLMVVLPETLTPNGSVTSGLTSTDESTMSGTKKAAKNDASKADSRNTELDEAVKLPKGK